MSAGAEPHIAEEQPGWLDNADNLIGFLRARGFVLGTGEVLRLLALLERLREEDARLSHASPDEVALWLAPVLCTSEAEQSALAPVLASYAASFKRPARVITPQDRAVTAGPASPERAATATIWATAGRSRLLLPSGLVLAIIVAGAIWWVSSRSGTAPTPPPSGPSGVPGPSIYAAAISVLAAASAAAFDALRFAAAPFLIRTLYLRWRGRRRPVLHRLAMPATIKAETVGVRGDHGASLFGDPDLVHAYQGLRAHRTVEGTRLDMKQTVRATIRAVGRLTRVNEQRPRLPEYPMLVEEMSSSDHLATVARVLYEQMQGQRVPAMLYAFAADLRRLRTAGVSRPISLGELRLRHEADVLLLISDGEVFWDSLNSRLRPSAEQLFRNWERLVLLTPVPLHRWSWRERALAETGVIVLPMTKAGVSALGNFLRAGGEPPQPALQQSPAQPTLITLEGRNAIEWLQDAPVPDDAERSGLLEAIAHELPKEAFDLLCILALFPEIRVDLTLHGLTNLRLRGAAVLEREEIFSALAALPWFRHGRIPDWLRLDLVRCLDPAQSAEAAKFYSAWLTSGSAPGTQGEIEIVTEPNGIFAEMRRRLRQGDVPSALKDAIFLRFSRGETMDDLDLEAPDQVAALLRPTWYSPERISLIVASAVALAITTAALWATPLRHQAPSSLVYIAVAVWIGCSLAAILAWRIQVLRAGKVRTQLLPIPLLLAAIGWLTSLGVPLVAGSPAFLIPLLLSLASLALTMRPERAQPREKDDAGSVPVPPRLERTYGDPAVERATVARTTRRLLPFLIICYFVAYLDRVNVGFAALTMNRDLNISQTAYGLGVGIFFLSYLLFGLPSNLLLERLGARKWIAGLMFSWGVLSGATAFVQSEYSFYVVRLLLGIAQAGFFPGIIYYLTLWFPAAYRARTIGYFMAAIPLSSVLGAPVSGALLGMDGAAGLHGWQWLFILEALPAVVLSMVAHFFLTDRPVDATWLEPDGRTWLSNRLDHERRLREAAERLTISGVLFNPRVLALSIVYFGAVACNYSLGIFVPQVVKSFGLSNLTTSYVTAIVYIVGTFAVIYWGRRSDRMAERKFHAAFALAAAGVGILAAAIVNDPTLKMISLSVGAFGVFGCLPVFWTLPTAFLSGAAAASGIALINSIGNLSGFTSPYVMGYIRDATGGSEGGPLVFAGLGFLGAVILLLIRHDRHLEQADAGEAAVQAEVSNEEVASSVHCCPVKK